MPLETEQTPNQSYNQQPIESPKEASFLSKAFIVFLIIAAIGFGVYYSRMSGFFQGFIYQKFEQPANSEFGSWQPNLR
jgi:hypothetical protein